MHPPLILFPYETMLPKQVDHAFAKEAEAARAAGFELRLYGHDEVCQGHLPRALRFIEPHPEHTPAAILRGWMMTGTQYAALYQAILEKAITLHTPPHAYDQAHYLPLAYPLIRDHTALTHWTANDDLEDAWQLYQAHFAQDDAMIKDWVKSAKFYWHEACFLPALATRHHFEGVFTRFREERGAWFNRGVVLRRMLLLETSPSSVTTLPKAKETRLFFWHGHPVTPTLTPDLPIQQMTRLASTFDSPFLTIDVARETTGTWKIIETGDGQVSGLPEDISPSRFYDALWEHCQAT